MTGKDHICGRPIGSEFRLEEDRIVAGYDIGYYRYPWYAALMRYGQVVCGGALIGPKVVVTAAHCYKEFLDLANKGYLKLETVYSVKMGVYNICTVENSQRNFNVKKVDIHEMYYGNKPYYDIALLTLADDTSMYQPICHSDHELQNKPKDGTVPGLGTLRYQGAMPCTVHEARIYINKYGAIDNEVRIDFETFGILAIYVLLFLLWCHCPKKHKSIQEYAANNV